VGHALRGAATDFYYHSIRFVPANIAWGACLLAIIAVAVWVSPLLAVAATPVLCLPLAGIARLAAQAVRGEDIVLSDMGTAMRSFARPALAAGVASTVAVVVLASNVVTGISTGGPLGWAVATLAAWGLVATWVLALCFWPLLVDPARARTAPSARARLAALVVLTQPVRLGRLAAILAVVSLASAIAFPALLSVSVSFVILVAARIVLPTADALEARLADAAGTEPA
jgi:hypothetical protein